MTLHMAHIFESADENLSDGEIRSGSEIHRIGKTKSTVYKDRRPRTNTFRQNHSQDISHDDSILDAESFLEAIRDEVICEDSVPQRTHISESEVDMEQDQEPGQINETNQKKEDKHLLAHKRREHNIWEGSFEVSNGTKRRSKQLTGTIPSSAPRKSPGVWLVEPGLRAPGISLPRFDVSEAAAIKAQAWSRGENLHDSEAEYLKVLLCCYPSEVDIMDPTQLPTGSSWPSLCLCIRIGEKVWSPFELDKQKGPIDISAFVKPGKNEIEIVQISGTPNYNYVVTAVHPTPRELSYSRRERQLKEAIRTWRQSDTNQTCLVRSWNFFEMAFSHVDTQQFQHEAGNCLLLVIVIIITSLNFDI